MQPRIVKSGIEYMAEFYGQYATLSKGRGIGFFQIGGGIAGDFPICVVPSIKYDLQKPVKPWAYFCQISTPPPPTAPTPAPPPTRRSPGTS
jgi:deoxyhypusine synthase